MTTLLVTLVAMSLLVFGLCIRIIFVKDGKFHGTCSTNSEFLKRTGDDSCPYCGKTAEEMCPNQPEIVNG
ncbi:MAG: hypothetical protein ACI8W8_000088 [Rhodothermales bacterium]|jgi:hypothetical protein